MLTTDSAEAAHVLTTPDRLDPRCGPILRQALPGSEQTWPDFGQGWSKPWPTKVGATSAKFPRPNMAWRRPNLAAQNRRNLLGRETSKFGTNSILPDFCQILPEFGQMWATRECSVIAFTIDPRLVAQPRVAPELPKRCRNFVQRAEIQHKLDQQCWGRFWPKSTKICPISAKLGQHTPRQHFAKLGQSRSTLVELGQLLVHVWPTLAEARPDMWPDLGRISAHGELFDKR